MDRRPLRAAESKVFKNIESMGRPAVLGSERPRGPEESEFRGRRAGRRKKMFCLWIFFLKIENCMLGL